MPLDCLSHSDLKVIGEALKASAYGPFFPDWEFRTLIGVERDKVRRIADSWPNVDETEEDVFLTLNNSLLNLWGYPHGKEEEWPQWFTVSGAQLQEVFERWRGAKLD